MVINRFNDRIEILSSEDFNLQQTLTSGQVFSYSEIDGGYLVVSRDYYAKILVQKDKTIIYSENLDYFFDYFDLGTDYSLIKKKICKMYFGFEKFFKNGNGIRLLRQDPYQTIISFIVSQNNNIKRIHGILDKIQKKYGKQLSDGIFGFPDLQVLSKVSVEEFKNLGCGYRSEYLVQVLKDLKKQEYNIDFLRKLSTKSLREMLVKLYGVGPKVADCILLFGFYRIDAFPVDTWIKKAYYLFDSKPRNVSQISDFLESIFKDLSGYAQMYIFNYMISQ